ncbi:MAG: hypothetical protein Q8P41_00615 [Pseudomonadota bacterium]|nr:hypothetical protein [Pseudomonadota bacterium]
MDVAEEAREPVAVELSVGEVLVRQSSGRHRAQVGLGVSVSVPVRGVWGVAFEAVGTGVAERSGQLELDQYLLRPAALATLTFARLRVPVTHVTRRRSFVATSPYLAFDLGLGPGAAVTLAEWRTPDLGAAWAVEPGVRGRAGLAFGVGEHLRVRLQGGLAWRPSGTDHDYLLGAVWAF